MRKALILTLAALPALCAAQDVTIAALGDSLTQGFGLPQTDGFVPQLQGWLDTRGIEAVVINAGVSGDTTAGGLARVRWTLTPEVDAMVVALGGNDMLRGLDPAISRANLTRILEVASEAEVEVLLVGMQAPGNYGPTYKAEFDSMFPDLARDFDVLYADSFFKGLGSLSDDPAAAQQFMQPDGIHPNAEGVARIVDGLGPDVAELVRRAQN